MEVLYKLPGIGKWVWYPSRQKIAFLKKGGDTRSNVFNLPMSNNTIDDARRIAANQEVLRLRKEQGSHQARNATYRSQSTPRGATNGQEQEATEAGDQGSTSEVPKTSASLP